MGGSIPEQIVDAIHDINGRHDGTRAVHAKGVVCAGTFTATREAASLTRAAHMQGEPGARDGAVLERRWRPSHARPREGRPRARGQALPRRRQPDGPGVDHAAELLRQDRRGLPRVHAGPEAGPGDRAARHGEARRLPRGASGGASRDSVRALTAGPGELRAARIPRDPRLQVDRPGRDGALGPGSASARSPAWRDSPTRRRPSDRTITSRRRSATGSRASPSSSSSR